MTLNEIMKAYSDACKGVDYDLGLVRELVNTSGTRHNLLARAARIHWRASHSPRATNAGIIGVGLITYAEHRVDEWLRRVERRFRLA
jgi:hypothetical protein